MTLKEKNIADCQVCLEKRCESLFAVVVRKEGLLFFVRLYGSLASARRSYNNWCVKLDDLHCEV